MTDSRVTKALERALELGEVGVQVAAYLGEELIVDAWAGIADRQTGRRVDGDTLFPVFSVTKGVTATALHIQAERGLVEYHAPVAKYWPEFAANGKAQTTVRDALSHRSGIPQMPMDVTPELMCDWDWMVHRIEEYRPWFKPGTTNAYGSLVWGWVIGEIVRRTDVARRPFGQFVQDEICKPLGIKDLYLGVPPSVVPRVAPLIADEPPTKHNPDHWREAVSPLEVYYSAPVHNRHDVWQACLPGAGAIMNARSSAQHFALLANGGQFREVRLLSEARLRSLTQPRDDPYAPDAVNGNVSWIGVGGYHLGGASPPANPLVGANPHILHHPGAGGSIAWADLDTQLSVAICHNWMHGPQTTLPGRHPFMPIAEAVRAVAADLSSSKRRSRRG